MSTATPAAAARLIRRLPAAAGERRCVLPDDAGAICTMICGTKPGGAACAATAPAMDAMHAAAASMRRMKRKTVFCVRMVEVLVCAASASNHLTHRLCCGR